MNSPNYSSFVPVYRGNQFAIISFFVFIRPPLLHKSNCFVRFFRKFVERVHGIIELTGF